MESTFASALALQMTACATPASMDADVTPASRAALSLSTKLKQSAAVRFLRSKGVAVDACKTRGRRRVIKKVAKIRGGLPDGPTVLEDVLDAVPWCIRRLAAEFPEQYTRLICKVIQGPSDIAPTLFWSDFAGMGCDHMVACEIRDCLRQMLPASRVDFPFWRARDKDAKCRQVQLATDPKQGGALHIQGDIFDSLTPRQRRQIYKVKRNADSALELKVAQGVALRAAIKEVGEVMVTDLEAIVSTFIFNKHRKAYCFRHNCLCPTSFPTTLILPETRFICIAGVECRDHSTMGKRLALCGDSTLCYYT